MYICLNTRKSPIAIAQRAMKIEEVLDGKTDWKKYTEK